MFLSNVNKNSYVKGQFAELHILCLQDYHIEEVAKTCQLLSLSLLWM